MLGVYGPSGIRVPLMICRHAPGDSDCSKNGGGYRSDPDPPARATVETPDASRYDVEDVKEVGEYLVLKAKYPNCARCAYEGMKVMVFKGVKVIDAIKWRRIDPHFRPTPRTAGKLEAPPPVARFPGSQEGWTDAVMYAQMKSGIRPA